VHLFNRNLIFFGDSMSAILASFLRVDWLWQNVVEGSCKLKQNTNGTKRVYTRAEREREREREKEERKEMMETNSD